MLTPREQDALNYITSHILQYGEAPLLSEIARALNISAKGHIHRILTALEDKGYIERTRRHRGIKLINGPKIGELPMLGRIAAGRPIEAISSNESINFATLLNGPNRYVLEVKGQSMENEGIFDGDMVIIQHQDSAHSNQIVVALIDGEEVTLKKIQFPDNNTIRLIPANDNMKPVDYAASRVAIQGILVGQVRIY